MAVSAALPRSCGIGSPPRGVVDGRMKGIRFALLVSVVMVCWGCARQLIPNTDVDDTPFNREVVEFCEEYRHAVEKRNVGLLVKMAHSDYYEDGGNIDTSDNIDREGLEGYLRDRFRNTKAIRYEIRYRRVGKGRNSTVFVDYTYSASYKLVDDNGEFWRRSVADNRLELIKEENGSFRIVAGM